MLPLGLKFCLLWLLPLLLEKLLLLFLKFDLQLYDEFCELLLVDLSNDLSPGLFVDLMLMTFMSHSEKELSSSLTCVILVSLVLPCVAFTKDISLLISTVWWNVSSNILMYESYLASFFSNL